MDTNLTPDTLSEEYPQEVNRQKKYQKEPDKARRANNKNHCKARHKSKRKALKGSSYTGR
jgi:hypothetical protein